MSPLLLIFLVVFAAEIIRQVTGFGFALLAMPLLTLFLGLPMATALVGLFQPVMSLTSLLTWHLVDRAAAWRLIVAAFVGIPLGLFLLRIAPEAWLKGGLGLLLIGYGLYGLLRPNFRALHHPVLTWSLGLFSGLLAGAYNTSGPPIVIYGTLRRWSPDRFRATLQFYFLITGIYTTIGQAMAGLWTWNVLNYFAWSLPAMFVGLVAGERINRHISPALFQRIIYGFLIVTGVLFFI